MLFNVTRMFYGSWGADFGGGALGDVTLGSLFPYVLTVVWVGRAHWAMVARRMFNRARPGDPVGRYLPYGAAGWGLTVALVTMAAWLVAAGASVIGAVVLVLLLMMMLLIITRVVAETGMIFVRIDVPLGRPWVLLGSLPERVAVRTTPRSFFYTALFSTLFTHDMRESLPVFATHAMRVADTTAYDDRGPERSARGSMPFIFALLAALVVGFVISGASMLHVEYAHASTLDRAQTAPINMWATGGSLTWQTMDPVKDYRPPNVGPFEAHDRWAYFGAGVVITSVLSVLRLRFVNWPLHPVGLLLAHSYAIKMVWFSVFVGWLLKAIAVRFGGASLLNRARPMFIGLIVGEAGAAAFWLVVTLVLHALGMEFRAVNLLPQ
jgi:hypothetical protein